MAEDIRATLSLPADVVAYLQQSAAAQKRTMAEVVLDAIQLDKRVQAEKAAGAAVVIVRNGQQTELSNAA